MSYAHLTLGERYVIYHLTLYGLGPCEIGRRLGRHHSTISRELKRNCRAGGAWVYAHDVADEMARARRREPRHRRRLGNLRLRRYVEARLRRDWSPEQIAGRLRREHPRDRRMRVSPETVYRWVYRDALAGGGLYRHLRRSHRRRRKQRRLGALRCRIVGRRGLALRPAIVAGRRRLGDWEGDTLQAGRRRGGLASLVERRSRYLLAGLLGNGCAAELNAAAIAALRRVPGTGRRTLTVDNGSEFARFKAIEAATGIVVYFADPYSAWQRGTNENTNGLLRQYFPKGAGLDRFCTSALAKAVRRLNHRPRKCLDYRTPHEVFHAELARALPM